MFASCKLHLNIRSCSSSTGNDTGRGTRLEMQLCTNRSFIVLLSLPSCTTHYATYEVNKKLNIIDSNEKKNLFIDYLKFSYKIKITQDVVFII